MILLVRQTPVTLEINHAIYLRSVQYSFDGLLIGGLQKRYNLLVLIPDFIGIDQWMTVDHSRPLLDGKI